MNRIMCYMRSDTKNKTDPVTQFIYIIQKIICDRLHSSTLLSLNTAAYKTATVQSNGADYFLKDYSGSLSCLLSPLMLTQNGFL